MPFADFFARSRISQPSRPVQSLVLGGALVIAIASTSLWAQVSGDVNRPAPPLPLSKPSTPALATKPMGPLWQELTAAQKQALAPLAATWNTLSSAHKNKWIALAQTYPTRSPTEQATMQSRMAEWAALTPAQRERARLNFAETKKVPPSERAADWETYKNLTTQEKRALAAQGKSKPVGAAVAITPVNPDKLTAVPITRRTAQQDGALAASKPRIDPNTLLPIPPAPAPSPAPTPSLPAVAASAPE